MHGTHPLTEPVKETNEISGRLMTSAAVTWSTNETWSTPSGKPAALNVDS